MLYSPLLNLKQYSLEINSVRKILTNTFFQHIKHNRKNKQGLRSLCWSLSVQNTSLLWLLIYKKQGKSIISNSIWKPQIDIAYFLLHINTIVKGSIRNSQKVIIYNRRHLKAGIYNDKNTVMIISTKMKISVHVNKCIIPEIVCSIKSLLWILEVAKITFRPIHSSVDAKYIIQEKRWKINPPSTDFNTTWLSLLIWLRITILRIFLNYLATCFT